MEGTNNFDILFINNNDHVDYDRLRFEPVSLCRYTLLLHHTENELRQFGLTDEMLIDQEW